MEIYLTEARLTRGLTKEGAIIPAGSKTICHAKSRVITTNGDILESIHTKLDTCGSVSIAHSSFLTQVNRAREHDLPPIRLTGIGGKSGVLGSGRHTTVSSARGKRQEHSVLRLRLLAGADYQNTSSQPSIGH